MQKFILATLAVCLLSDSIADAQLFRRRRARRNMQTPATAPACPGGVCNLTINPNEGFEGALPLDYFQQQQQQPQIQPQQLTQWPQPIPAYSPPADATSTVLLPAVDAIASPPAAVVVQPPVVVEQSAVTTKETTATKTPDGALLEALATNLAAMQKVVERMSAQQQSATANASKAGEAISELPLIRITIVARDGGENREEEIDVAELVRERLTVK